MHTWTVNGLPYHDCGYDACTVMVPVPVPFGEMGVPPLGRFERLLCRVLESVLLERSMPRSSTTP